ncbi:MAG: beta-lactamase family protein [Ignavibacterium sp.]|nr:beta-lactamase family protein [Ignavibacterium sp.]
MKLKTIFILSLNLLVLNLCAQNTKYDFADVESVVKSGIKDKAFPGAVVLVWQNGSIIYENSFGKFTYEENSPVVNKNTMFDLASLTKVIATTTAAMLCIDRSFFNLDDKVAEFIPEFGNNNKENITIRNLLLHNSGLPAFIRFYEKGLNNNQVLNEIYSAALEYNPGEKTIYSDLGFITLGKVIEKVTGKTLEKFCTDEIFKPLEMNSTYFNVPDSLKKYCAPTEIDNYWRMKTIQGEVHDENSYILNGVAGHAGLFSTAGDIAKIMSMLMNKGKVNGREFLKSGTIEMFTKRFGSESTRALGWDTKSEKGSTAGNYFSSNSFGHLGFTGTSVWADPVRNLFVVFLTNRVYPTRENSGLTKVRPALHDAVIKDINQSDER